MSVVRTNILQGPCSCSYRLGTECYAAPRRLRCRLHLACAAESTPPQHLSPPTLILVTLKRVRNFMHLPHCANRHVITCNMHMHMHMQLHRDSVFHTPTVQSALLGPEISLQNLWCITAARKMRRADGATRLMHVLPSLSRDACCVCPRVCPLRRHTQHVRPLPTRCSANLTMRHARRRRF